MTSMGLRRRGKDLGEQPFDVLTLVVGAERDEERKCMEGARDENRTSREGFRSLSPSPGPARFLPLQLAAAVLPQEHDFFHILHEEVEHRRLDRRGAFRRRSVPRSLSFGSLMKNRSAAAPSSPCCRS